MGHQIYREHSNPLRIKDQIRVLSIEFRQGLLIDCIEALSFSSMLIWYSLFVVVYSLATMLFDFNGLIRI